MQHRYRAAARAKTLAVGASRKSTGPLDQALRERRVRVESDVVLGRRSWQPIRRFAREFCRVGAARAGRCSCSA
jgi:hypothetical protein